MSRPIRLLIADDSAVARRLLSEAVSQETDIELVGVAKNGDEAVVMFHSLKPDVVLLDVEMPVADGIIALRAIRSSGSTTPVIMFSALTVRDGEATLDALTAGASDYVSKPTGIGHVDKVIAYLRTDVNSKIRMWGQRVVRPVERPVGGFREAVCISRKDSSPGGRVENSAVFPSQRDSVPKILAIGASTGGPDALATLIGHLPANLGVPVVIVQHMPAIFTQLLAERLNRCSSLHVREGVDGTVLIPGDVWLAPGDFHMTVARQGGNVVLRTSQTASEHFCRPAVDVLLRSVASVYGGHCLAVILTGMGRDGTAACGELHKLGATILVQDEASSTVWGMPKSVFEAGYANATVPLQNMSADVTARIRRTTPIGADKPRDSVPVFA